MLHLWLCTLATLNMCCTCTQCDAKETCSAHVAGVSQWVVILCRACVHEGCRDKRARLQQSRCPSPGEHLHPRRDLEALPCCSVTCRHSKILEFVSFLRDEFLLQSPVCLLLTRRIADNHGMRFASQHWSFSLQPLERGTPTAHRPT